MSVRQNQLQKARDNMLFLAGLCLGHKTAKDEGISEQKIYQTHGDCIALFCAINEPLIPHLSTPDKPAWQRN